MNNPQEAIDALLAEAKLALHPTEGPTNVLASRVAALERQVAYLARRLHLLERLLPDARDLPRD